MKFFNKKDIFNFPVSKKKMYLNKNIKLINNQKDTKENGN